MKSYNYIKHFIDSLIKELNRPIEISPQLRDLLTEENINIKQFQIILMRINLLIKRHNSNMFSLRVINQIIHQIIKSENYKMDLTAERMVTVGKVMKPLVIPDSSHINHNNAVHLEELDMLAKELPEAKYLFVGSGSVSGLEKSEDGQIRDVSRVVHSDVGDVIDRLGHIQSQRESIDQLQVIDNQTSTIPETIPAVTTNDSDSLSHTSVLVQDYDDLQIPSSTEERHFKQKLYTEIDNQTAIQEPLMAQYDATRTNIIEINKTLQYKRQKLAYLQQLRNELEISLLGKGPLSQQIDRFKLLVDSIRFRGQNSTDLAQRLRT